MLTLYHLWTTLLSWVLHISAVGLLIGGATAIVYGRLPFMPYVRLATAGGAVALAVGGFLAGEIRADQRQEVARLRAELDARQREVVAVRKQAASLSADAETAQRQAESAEARAQAAEAVAATIPATGGLSADTSTKVREMWK